MGVIATFFAGFAIADLSALNADLLAALSPLAKQTYVLCQSLTVTLNLFAALTMVFVDISSRRMLVGEKCQSAQDWAAGLNGDGDGAALSHLHRMEKPLGTCQPYCPFLFVSNLAWHAVLLSGVLYIIAL